MSGTGTIRRRVLFVTTTLGEGGAERFVSNVTCLLDPARFDMEIAVLRPKIDYPIPEGIPVHDLGKRRVRDNPRAIARLRRVIRDGAYDVVFGALSTANQMLLPAIGFSAKRPGWIACVDSDPRARDQTGDSGFKRSLERALLRGALRRADCIAPKSMGSAEGVLSLIPDAEHRMTILPNIINFAEFDRRAAEPGQLDLLALETPVLITVARLESAKRLDIALRAFAKAVADGSPGHFAICGDGSLGRELKDLAKDLGLGDRVSFLGFCGNPFAEMRAADIFVLSSDREGLPNALIEAQGLGLPAVATDCRSGPREIVDDGTTGILVPTGDVDAFASALSNLMRDDQRRARFGAEAARQTRERYGPRRHLPVLEDLLMQTEASG